MICNVFLFISVWFLCERMRFSTERILKVWITVFIYSMATGIFFYFKTGNRDFLIAHLFPISNNLVWYATMYMGILLLSPMLNRLLTERNRELTAKVCVVFFIAVCVLPTFWPKSARLGSVMSWFILAYLIIGVMKVNGIMFNKKTSLLLFISGWAVCLGFYNGYDRLVMIPDIARLFKGLGLSYNLYFADLASLPCCFSALGIFCLFLQIKIKTEQIFGWVLRFVSLASLDVYIVASMESPSVKLAWVEMMGPAWAPVGWKQCYAMILVGLLIGIVLGNLRERAWRRIVGTREVAAFLSRLDGLANGRDVSRNA